ncbi:MAG TPA: hypothetical protein ENL06_00260 [Candidatus Portnoybacteria bacterium]|nr:hypothetical protein [Candidatus Portnoybacteria bacterium]
MAKNQKIRIEKMLKSIAESKQFSFQQKLKFDRHNYHKESQMVIKEELNKVKKISTVNKFQEFENIIEKFKNELYKFEEKNIKNFYYEWNYSFKTSSHITNVSDEEKSYWTTPYTKIFFDKNKFKTTITKIDSLRYLKELIGRWVKFFKKFYNINLIMINFELEIEEEALFWYSNFYNLNGYITKNDDDIYFEDMDEAREYLQEFLNFEHKNRINIIHSLLEVNQENFERYKRNFHTQYAEKTKGIKKLQEELNKFIKEKKEYVTRVQR